MSDLQPRPDEYDGPAAIRTLDGEVPVEVTLRSFFEPIDGKTHWSGRIATSAALGAACSTGQTVTLTVGDLSAEGRLSDIDPWGRFRIGGTGQPPIP